jgi:hypothetical protein
MVVVLFLLNNKKKLIKFRAKAYLANLNDSDRNIVIPYFKGIFILGILLGLLLAVVDDGCELLINKIQQTKAERIHAYEYIGRCYVNKDCRPIMLDVPVQTDQDLVNLVTKIRLHILSKEK